MKRRTFLKNSTFMVGGATMAMPVLGNESRIINNKSVFEWKVYHISRTGNAKKILEQYFIEALIPFLNKKNITFGAFNDYSLEEPVKLYVLIGYPDVSTFFALQKELLTDEDYLKASKEFNAISADKAVYERYETFLLEAFEGFPALKIPVEKKGLFELRLYESASDEAGRKKIGMFNKEEIAVFLKTGIQPVFFGKIIAGQYMPGLLYMVGFKDMAARDTAWSNFSVDSDWKTMREKPEYDNIVSNIRKIFLTPAEYSQV